MDVVENNLGIDHCRKVIHNRYYNVSGVKYWVEISFSNDTAFVILFSKHGDNQQEFLAAVMPLVKAQAML